MSHKRAVLAWRFAGVCLLTFGVAMCVAKLGLDAKRARNAAIVDELRQGNATERNGDVHYQTGTVERCFLGLLCEKVTAVRVFLASAPLEREFLADLLRLRALEHLRLTGENLGLQAISHIDDMRHLREFECKLCRFDSQSVPRSDLRLMSLVLNGSEVSYSTLAALVAAGTVRQLHLGECNITRFSEVPALIVRRLPELEVLDLTGMQLTDDLAKPLTRLPWLRELYLGGTLVTDTTLENLSGADRLEVLWLSKTRITDRGFVALANCPALREVQIAGCEGVSDDAVAWLSSQVTVVGGHR